MKKANSFEYVFWVEFIQYLIKKKSLWPYSLPDYSHQHLIGTEIEFTYWKNYWNFDVITYTWLFIEKNKKKSIFSLIFALSQIESDCAVVYLCPNCVELLTNHFFGKRNIFNPGDGRSILVDMANIYIYVCYMYAFNWGENTVWSINANENHLPGSTGKSSSMNQANFCSY